MVNHTNGEEQEHTRNVLVESARIARGDVKPLSELSEKKYDMVIFPGGFGAAKNLCSFGTEGTAMTVHPEVVRVLKEFEANKKHIGMCCIAPIIGAKVFGKESGGKGL